MSFNKKEYYVVHIIELFLDQKRLEQIGNFDMIEYLRNQRQPHPPLLSFPLTLWCFFPLASLHTMFLNSPTSLSSKYYKYSNYDKTAYIVFSYL